MPRVNTSRPASSVPIQWHVPGPAAKQTRRPSRLLLRIGRQSDHWQPVDFWQLSVNCWNVVHDVVAQVGGLLRSRRLTSVGLKPSRCPLIHGAATEMTIMKASSRIASMVIRSR